MISVYVNQCREQVAYVTTRGSRDGVVPAETNEVKNKLRSNGFKLVCRSPWGRVKDFDNNFEKIDINTLQ